MKHVLIIISIFLIVNNAFGQFNDKPNYPYLETTAKVDTLVQPDLIYMTIVISEKDERNRVSVEDLERKMFMKLKTLGIDIEKQLSVSDLASNFKTYFLKKKDIIKSKAYSLKVFNSETTGRVLEAMEDIDISNIDLDKIEYSKEDELRLELRSLAVEKAKKQATFLTAPLNQNVLKAIEITDLYYGNINNYSLDEVVITGMGINSQNLQTNPTVDFKPLIISAEVRVKFQID